MKPSLKLYLLAIALLAICSAPEFVHNCVHDVEDENEITLGFGMEHESEHLE